MSALLVHKFECARSCASTISIMFAKDHVARLSSFPSPLAPVSRTLPKKKSSSSPVIQDVGKLLQNLTGTDASTSRTTAIAEFKQLVQHISSPKCTVEMLKNMNMNPGITKAFVEPRESALQLSDTLFQLTEESVNLKAGFYCEETSRVIIDVSFDFFIHCRGDEIVVDTSNPEYPSYAGYLWIMYNLQNYQTMPTYTRAGIATWRISSQVLSGAPLRWTLEGIVESEFTSEFVWHEMEQDFKKFQLYSSTISSIHTRMLVPYDSIIAHLAEIHGDGSTPIREVPGGMQLIETTHKEAQKLLSGMRSFLKTLDKGIALLRQRNMPFPKFEEFKARYSGMYEQFKPMPEYILSLKNPGVQ